MPQQLRAVAIVRMSDLRQTNSPERQREAFAAYCQRYELVPCGEYADHGVSATKTRLLERPAIQQLLADAPKAKWTVVWFEEVSRAARKGEEVVYLDNALRAENRFLVGPEDDPRAQMDAHFRKLMLFLGGWKAEDETKRMGIRIGDTQKMLVARGKPRGGQHPLGLRWHWTNKETKEGAWEVDEETAPTIIRLFELFAETGCYRQVALRLDEEGHTTRRGAGWSICGVKDLLRNPTYRGKRVFRGQLYEIEGLPQIVPAELVAIADEKLAQKDARPQRATVTFAGYASRSIFAGLLRCPECGGWLQVHYWQGRKSGQSYLCYACAHSRMLPVSCTWRRMVPQLSFERAILPQILEALRKQARSLSRMSEPRRHKEQAKRTLARLREERTRLLSQHQRGWIDDHEAGERLADLDSRIAQAQDTQGQQEQPVTLEQIRQVLATINKQWGNLTPAQKRSLLQAVVDHIIPHGEDWSRSQIVWRNG